MPRDERPVASDEGHGIPEAVFRACLNGARQAVGGGGRDTMGLGVGTATMAADTVLLVNVEETSYTGGFGRERYRYRVGREGERWVMKAREFWGAESYITKQEGVRPTPTPYCANPSLAVACA